MSDPAAMARPRPSRLTSRTSPATDHQAAHGGDQRLAAALLVTAAIDVSRGITPIMAETDHLTEIVGAVLVWLTAHSVSHPTPRPRPTGHLHVART
jgi:hypothetical protein